MARHQAAQHFPSEYIADLQAAAQTIHAQVNELAAGAESFPFAWLKLAPAYPAFCDQAFAFKNQVFAYLVDRLNDKGESNVSEEAKARLLAVASQNNLIPCRFVLKPDHTPLENGWNLVRLDDGCAVNPPDVSDDKPVERSAWERMEIAVATAAEWLIDNRAGTISASCAIPGADPQIWFHGNDGGDAWILVRDSDAEPFDEKRFFEEHPTLKSCAGYKCVVNLGAEKSYRGFPVEPSTDGPMKIHMAGDGSRVEEEAPLGSKPLCAEPPSDE
ncbi:MAG: hypothetical protein MJ106_02125, partial [Lentisphaeria bacterium]|nr:hypothetical protein [Lentisphaeria bacterium]